MKARGQIDVAICDRIQTFTLPLPISTMRGQIVAIRMSRELPEREWIVQYVDYTGREYGGGCGMSYKMALEEMAYMISGLLINLPDYD